MSEDLLVDGTLVLRAITPADYPRILEITIYDGVFAKTEADVQRIVEKIEDDVQRGDSVHWVMEDTALHELVGTMGFYRGFPNQTGEIGYIVKPEFRGRGYVTRAIRCACRYGFARLGLREVVAYTGIDNAASRKALAKNGFLPAGETGNMVKYAVSRRPSDGAFRRRAF